MGLFYFSSCNLQPYGVMLLANSQRRENMAKKSITTHYDTHYLHQRTDEAGHIYYCMTRVAAYKRYIHTIKPLDDLLKSLEAEVR